jgi:hypothetical protein
MWLLWVQGEDLLAGHLEQWMPAEDDHITAAKIAGPSAPSPGVLTGCRIKGAWNLQRPKGARRSKHAGDRGLEVGPSKVTMLAVPRRRGNPSCGCSRVSSLTMASRFSATTVASRG